MSLDIPAFLKRTETEEQAEKRRKKYAPKDTTDGLKVKRLPDPKDPLIAKALAKAFKDDGVAKTPLPDHGDLIATAKPKKSAPKKEKKLPAAIAKAVAEKEKRESICNQMKAIEKAHNGKAPDAKPDVVVPFRKKATKTKKEKADRKSKYDWTAAETMAKNGKLPPLPPFNSYKEHIEKFYELAKKKDVKGIKELSAEYKDETGARANMFRFRDLLLVALKH